MKNTRIQFDLTEEKAEELNRFMKEVHTSTKKELINNSLTLLKWAVNEVKQGRIIASVDENEQKYKEICMPVLSGVAKHDLTPV